MHQDEAGRWVSDNGRYLWSGSEWLDLEQDGSAADADTDRTASARDAGSLRTAERPEAEPDAEIGAASGADDLAAADDRDAGADADADAGAVQPPVRAAVPAAAGPPGHRRRGPQPTTRGGPGRPGRGRRLLVGLAIVVLVAVVAVVLVVDNHSSSHPTSAAPAPAPGGATPGAAPRSAAATAVLDEQQRRDRAEASLVTQADVPTSTEQRPVDPTDVFLPCRAPALTPPAGTVLAGRTVSNSDFTVYVGQTVAGYPSVREASDALDTVRSALGRCAPYDYDYANSPRVDHITHVDVGQPLAIADGGVYLAEIDTPANYAGTPTTYSYGYVRQGQFLVRLTLTTHSQADRAGLETLMRRITAQLGRG